MGEPPVTQYAGPRQLLVSQTIKEHLVGSSIALSEHGVQVLKGVPERWRLFSVEG